MEPFSFPQKFFGVMGRNMVNGKVIWGDGKLNEMKAGGDEKQFKWIGYEPGLTSH